MPDPLQPFKYPGPDGEGARVRGEGRGSSFDLVTNDRVISTVQVMKKGEGNRLHAHRDQDGYWFILAGRARFHGIGEEILAELGRNEGIFVPHNTRYWFESVVVVEPLEILRVSQLLPADGT
jgi:mannose-6-phosphate isomerase-like protein (cupin superfamily)